MSKYEGHTPGPWEVSSYFLRSANGHHIHWDNLDTGPHPMGPEMKANAQLMQDAPMLAERVEILTAEKAQKQLVIDDFRNQLNSLAEQNAKLLKALKEAHEENKLSEDAIGGCDHEVGICVCGFSAMIADHAALITEIEEGEG